MTLIIISQKKKNENEIGATGVLSGLIYIISCVRCYVKWIMIYLSLLAVNMNVLNKNLDLKRKSGFKNFSELKGQDQLKLSIICMFLN